MTQSQLFTLLKQVFGQANILTVPTLLLKKLKGNHAAALFLSQLIYWSDKTANNDGWVRKSYADWEAELFIKRDKAIAIKKLLEKLGLIETRVLKTSAAPVVHYRIKEDALLAFLADKPERTKKTPTATVAQDVPEKPLQDDCIANETSEEEVFQESEAADMRQNPRSIVGKAHDGQSENPTIDSGRNQRSTGYIDYYIDYPIDTPLFPETEKAAEGEEKNKRKLKRPSLREREPVNDFEKVEKAYLTIWDKLFAAGIVKTAEPVVNWQQSRKLLQALFKNFKAETVISALYKAQSDCFILDGGFSLTTILASSVLNRLLNAHYTTPEARAYPYRKSATIQSDQMRECDYL